MHLQVDDLKALESKGMNGQMDESREDHKSQERDLEKRLGLGLSWGSPAYHSA